MFDGVKTKSGIDSEQEFQLFTSTINVDCPDDMRFQCADILRGMFYGVMRNTMGYLWLRECPKQLNTSGIKFEVCARQEDDGRYMSNKIGNWEIDIKVQDGELSEDTMQILASFMERFVQVRFNLKEPQGLDALALQMKRENFVREHFFNKK